jgi:hypothetical protein
MASLTAKSAEVPWHAAYPAVKTASIPTITCKELLRWYEEGKKPGLDFVLVDLRRADHEVRLRFLSPFILCILLHANPRTTVPISTFQTLSHFTCTRISKDVNLKLIMA